MSLTFNIAYGLCRIETLGESAKSLVPSPFEWDLAPAEAAEATASVEEEWWLNSSVRLPNDAFWYHA